MALVRGSANPYNTLGIRRLKHAPPHFARITSAKVDTVDLLDNWIYTKLDSRYCIRKVFHVNEDKKVVEIIEIAVEDAKELSMLSLGCPYL